MRFAAFLLAVSAAAAAQSTTPAGNWSYQGKTGALEWGGSTPLTSFAPKAINSRLSTFAARASMSSCSPSSSITSPVPSRSSTTAAPSSPKSIPGSYILAGGVRYELVEYSFHHPSEATVRGKLSDMEIQLLHKSADGNLAVVAIRLVEDIGNPNATLATLWPHLPSSAGATAKVDEMVSTAGLLPSDRGYWTYTGSLTTPPCTEGVRWFVFEQELGLSRSQLRAFAALFRINTRGLQDPHGRRIEADE